MAVFKIEILALLLCSAALAHGHGFPTISRITRDQIREIGGQVDLNCTVHGDRDFPVLWVKYDCQRCTIFIISSNSGLVVTNPRFSYRYEKYDNATTTYALSLKDLQEDDAGWYECQVIMFVAKWFTAFVELQVRSPPFAFISNNSTRSVVASETERVYGSEILQAKSFCSKRNSSN